MKSLWVCFFARGVGEDVLCELRFGKKYICIINDPSSKGVSSYQFCFQQFLIFKLFFFKYLARKAPTKS